MHRVFKPETRNRTREAGILRMALKGEGCRVFGVGCWPLLPVFETRNPRQAYYAWLSEEERFAAIEEGLFS